MATEEYMTSQTYSATIGGTVYNVTANLGTIPGQLGWANVKARHGREPMACGGARFAGCSDNFS